MSVIIAGLALSRCPNLSALVPPYIRRSAFSPRARPQKHHDWSKGLSVIFTGRGLAAPDQPSLTPPYFEAPPPGPSATAGIGAIKAVVRPVTPVVRVAQKSSRGHGTADRGKLGCTALTRLAGEPQVSVVRRWRPQWSSFRRIRSLPILEDCRPGSPSTGL